MPDFPNLTPPLNVTNPGAMAGHQEYPRHLHKWAGLDDKGHAKPNDYVVVTTDAEKEAALAAGYALTPQGPPAPVQDAPVQDAPAVDADEPKPKGKKKDAA